MLSAAEASIDASAEDDNERSRNRAKLYAPPKGSKAPARRERPAGTAMNRSQVQDMMARLAAEDARLGAG
ncbi:hypothetical protein ACWFR1_12175 [Streptomyces sp. NPDC055103]